jgi:VanZ family protein
MITISSSQSTVTAPENIFGADKIAHFIAFLIYGVFSRIFMEIFKSSARSKYFIAILIAISFGIIDEVHQYFVPGRDASIYDLIADILGLIVSTFFWSRILKILRKITRNKCLN